MSEDEKDDLRGLRLSVHALLIVLSLASAAGRIGAVEARDGRTPFLSANDRSRWCTVRALVELGTYEIDEVIRDRGWDSIDKVQHVGRDGEVHFYSSKPPLLATLVAVPCWMVHKVTGATLSEHPFYVGRAVLMLVQLPLMGLLLLCICWLVEQFGTTFWGRVFVVAVGCWGTFLTTMVATFNNHLPAAAAVAVALCALVRLLPKHCEESDEDEDENTDDRGGGIASSVPYALAGFFAAFAVTNDLPALSFFAAAGLICWFRNWSKTLLAFVPGASVVVAGFFLTNWLAHADLRPPYMHRGEVDNWYDYENSYWLVENRRGVDRGEPSRLIYALHSTIGHHGVLSLTPVWLLSIVGVGWMLVDAKRRRLGWMILLLSLICMVFYIMRPLGDRNYGGVTCGFRWMYWFAPLWLAAMVPVADAMSRYRAWRVVAITLLVVSTLSAAYGLDNPWKHPWIYTYGEFMTWW